MDEEKLEKKDLKYVRQSMYRERKKLQPAQSKNQAEFLLMEHSRSSVCAFVSRIWSNSPLRIILIDSSVNTLAKQDLYGASPSNFSIRRPGGISGLLLQ
jgi:hypothetical protein